MAKAEREEVNPIKWEPKIVGNRVLCERVTVLSKSAGGIVMPDTSQDKLPWEILKILQVGDGKLLASGTRIPIKYRPGDYILAPRGTGGMLTKMLDGREWILLDADNVLWVWDRSNADADTE